MKYWFAITSLSFVLCSLLAAQSNAPAPAMPAPKADALKAPAPTLNVADEIVKLERDWLAAEASGDLTSLQTLISDDFIGSGPGGRVLTKDDILPAPDANTNRLPKSSLGESTVRAWGDCAVLMGTVVFDHAKQQGGLRVTNVYQKRDDRWQMIAAHLSPAPVPEQ